MKLLISVLLSLVVNQISFGQFIKDKTLFQRNKIKSIRHKYIEGTMLNNIGNRLKIRTVHFEDNIFSKQVGFEKYLCSYFPDMRKKYNYFLFTRKITHSRKLKNKIT